MIPLYLFLASASVHFAQGASLEKINCDNIPDIDETCCEIPDLDPDGLDDDKISDECFREMKEGPNQIREDHKFECLEECVFKRFGFLNDYNMLDTEKLNVAIVKQFSNDSVWKETFTQATNLCAEGAPNMVEDKSPCKSGAGYFTMCLATELIKNCPKKYWNESANCTMLKHYLDKCPEVAM